MESYEIYWDDLTPKAQKRLKPLYHENVDLTPLSIIEVEEERDGIYDEDDDEF